MMLHDSVQAHSEHPGFQPFKKKILPLRLDLSLSSLFERFLFLGGIFTLLNPPSPPILLHQKISRSDFYHHIISRLDKINPA